MRLTWRRADGEVCPRIEKGTDIRYIAGEFTQKVYDKLAAYEDAEEQGLLIRLPCKLGDTVYHIVSHTSHTVDVTGCRMEWKLEDTIEPTVFRIWMVDAIGKTIFLTHEEAETALKGTEKGR